PRSAVTLFVPNYPFTACVVRSNGPVQWMRIERRTPLYPRLGTIREALLTEMRAASAWPRRVTDVRPLAAMARLMGREWFAPLEPALAGVRHLIVCSPDLVAGGPLGVLIDERGRYLADRFV